MNYAFFSVWLALGFSGWIIACAGLSALQRYENHSGISDGLTTVTRTHHAAYKLMLVFPFCMSTIYVRCGMRGFCRDNYQKSNHE